VHSRFYRQKSGYSGMFTQSIVDLAVKNGTSSAVSRAFFKGTISSPGRAVPWLKRDFNYEIPGGLEPGEAANWKLEPNGGGWDVEVPKDAVLTVTVERLNGPEGKTLYDAAWSDEDQQRLEALRKTASR
jgi:hypothetical protein